MGALPLSEISNREWTRINTNGLPLRFFWTYQKHFRNTSGPMVEKFPALAGNDFPMVGKRQRKKCLSFANTTTIIKLHLKKQPLLFKRCAEI